MNPTPTRDTAAASRIAENKKLRASGMSFMEARNAQRGTPTVEPTVSASALMQPAPQVTVPTPAQPSIPSTTLNVARNVSRDVNGFIAAQTEEAAKLKELQATYGALGAQGSLQDLFKTTREEMGATPEAISELKDIQLRLADMDTESGLTKTRIQGAAGQTLAQGQREVTQEDRENAVRTTGLAARAAVIQGNIETATQLARDTVNIAYQDRTLNATNLLNQIEMVQGQVDDQTAQLLEEEKRSYEAELAKIEEVKTNVANAMVNGATQAEITQLNDPTLADDAKIALAQQITARGATQMRDLDLEAKRANISQSYASANASRLSAEKTQAEINALNNTATGASNIAVQALDSFSGTLNENNREQFTKALTGAVKRGNVEQTEVALKNAAQAAAGSALREDVIKRDQAIGALRKVQAELAEYEKAGGNTNLLTGGYEDLQNKLGKTADPKLAAIETRINLALNAYTNAVSGASFTPQESQRYASLFPSTSNTNQLNTTKVDTLIDSFDANNQVFYGNFYGGYTPSQLAEQAVYEELVANATPEQLAELGITN